MAVTWTREQEQVIESRGRSLLVSAAAGSGKTAVLVARILSRIMDPEDPVDVDRMLVVTFTNAAASGMRERITAAVEEALRNEPENIHLQRQSALIHNAQITTIHRFCLQLIRSHFHTIGLDPDFRVADPGELHLMKEEVFESVIEKFFQKEEDDFVSFTENYSSGKNEDAIRDMVFELYEQAVSNPWPLEWIRKSQRAYDITEESDLSEMKWYQKLMTDLKLHAAECAKEAERLISLSLDADGPASYEGALRDDLSFFRGLEEEDQYEIWYELLSGHKFTSLKADRKFDGSTEKRDEVKDRREVLKKQTEKWKKEYFVLPLSEQIEGIRHAGKMFRVLCDLTICFADEFAKQKKKERVIDFSDIEHFALQILLDQDSHEPTEIAKEYQKKFKEVMIDEYQDSNFVQEALLSSVSGDSTGIRNRFMVGDIKQSIYRFRLARPELFLEKYDSYAADDAQNDGRERIDLHQNFRSREEILHLTNRVFSKVMQKDIGNVVYDDAAALRHGRNDEEDPAGNYTPEIILLDHTGPAQEQAEKEARVIAERIRRMIREEEIPGLTYGDIVILMRGPSGVSEIYQDAFHKAGIPLLVETKTGYFSAREVQQVLSFLQIIDNPMQDIPLAAAMKSPFGSFTSEEMALIRIAYPGIPFYEAVRCFSTGLAAENISDISDTDKLQEKVSRFLDKLSVFRGKMRDMPIYRLLEEIYDTTGFMDEVRALPAGRQRKANLDMLMEKAIAFSKTSYQGLLHFNKYIERLRKYDVDFGEAEVPDDGACAVRLMSIHKSKGLEFPVVFLAGTGKQFNEKDLGNTLVIHPENGCGLRDIDRKMRTKKDTLLRLALSADLKKENLGEEMRVLYVAMTRAEKKLILTGSLKADRLNVAKRRPDDMEPGFSERFQAKCYLDWILMALSQEEKDQIIFLSDEDQEESGIQAAKELRLDQNALYREVYQADKKLIGQLDQNFGWRYPHPDTAGRQQKVSVSEIKHRAYEENRKQMEFDAEANLYEEEILHPYVPKFMQEEAETGGARYGTAMHFALQNLDFSGLPDNVSDRDQYIHERLLQLQKDSDIDPQMLRKLSEKQIRVFTRSELAERMHRCAAEGMLFLEQPFVMSLAADRIWTDAKTDLTGEEVLTQGIIDAFWVEEGGIVLLDYKTDRVDTPDELLQRYEVQLRLYEEALNRRFPDQKVKEIWIYSFWLGEAVEVK